MTAVKVVLGLTLKSLLTGWRALAAALLAVLPVLLCAVLVWVRETTTLLTLSPGGMWRALVAGYMHALAILTALLFASSAIADDEEDGSVFYLLVRPVRRSLVYLGKTLGAVILAALTCVLSLSLCGMTLALAGGRGIPLATTLRDAAWVALAAAAYAVALAAVSALSRRALLFSAFYLLLFELPMAFAPTGLRYLTVSHHLLSLLQHPSPWHAVIRTLGMASPAAAAWLGLAAVLIAWVTIGALRYERREHLAQS